MPFILGSLDGRTDRRLSYGYIVRCITCSRTVQNVAFDRLLTLQPTRWSWEA